MIQTATKKEWYDDYYKIVEFGKYLIKEEGYTATEILGYFEKPWNWNKEHIEWLNNEH